LLTSVLFVACGISHDEIAQALENEGINVEYGDSMSNKNYDYNLNGKERLLVMIEEDQTKLQEAKSNLEENAKLKGVAIRFYSVDSKYLFVYYPSNESGETGNKIQQVVDKLNE
jgi:hypothetical protein